MEPNIFQQPLTFDVLMEISKVFPAHARINNMVLRENECNGGGPISHGRFYVSLNESDILSTALDCKRFILIEDKDLSGTKDYAIFVIHITGQLQKYLSIRDTTEPEVPGEKLSVISEDTLHSNWFEEVWVHAHKNPRTHFNFLEKPFNLVVMVPCKKNNRENTVDAFIGSAGDGSVFIDYRRFDKDPYGIMALRAERD